jgi:hypothetical protein
MPGDLEGTYDELAGRINRQSQNKRQLAWCALFWIINVKRPLRPVEIIEALAVEPGTKALDLDNLYKSTPRTDCTYCTDAENLSRTNLLLKSLY